MKIGFIGLGIMGRPMAKNLLKAGYDITVDSHSPAAAAELEACGAKVADQPTIGSTCDLVLTMLPNAPQVKQVMLGANGVAAHMQPGSTFIDMTSLNHRQQGDRRRTCLPRHPDAGRPRFRRRTQGD